MIWIVQTLFPKASWPPTVVLHEKRKGFFPYFCHFSTTSSSPHLCFDHAFVLISLANFSSLFSPVHFLHQTPLIVPWYAFLLYSIFILLYVTLKQFDLNLNHPYFNGNFLSALSNCLYMCTGTNYIFKAVFYHVFKCLKLSNNRVNHFNIWC